MIKIEIYKSNDNVLKNSDIILKIKNKDFQIMLKIYKIL